MGKGIVKLGEGNWAVKDGNLLAAKETNGRFKNTEFTVSRGTRASYVGRDGLIKESNLQDVNLVNNGDFSELGSELVVNGTFDTDSDWTLENGAVINNGSVNIIGVGSRFRQDVLTVGKTYKLDYQVVSTNGESFRFQDGLTAFTDINQTVGYHTYYFVATGVRVQFQALGDINARIDNVSVKEVDPNDYWTLGSAWNIENGKAVAISGVSGKILQTNTLNGKYVKVTLTVSNYGGTGVLLVDFGSVNSSYITSDGTHTFYGTYDENDFAIYKSSPFTGSIDNISVKEVKTDTPRIDFTDNTDGHLLLEPQSTNLLPYSEDFTQSNWIKHTDIVLTPNQTSPDGSNNAYKVQGTIGSSYILDGGFSAVTTQSRSIYMKADTNGVVYSLGDGQSHQINVTTEWQRFELQEVSNSIYAVDFRGSGVTLDTVYIWAAQLEELSHPTSYIPTNGSTVTRDEDTCTDAGEAIDFNSEEGVLYAEIAALANDGGNRRISISDGSETNRLNLFYTATTNEIKANYRVSNSTVVTIDTTDFDITSFNKIAFRWQSGNFVLFINGQNKGTNSNTTMISANTLNVLRFEDPNLINEFYGKCKALRVYKEALSDTDLQNLTS